MTHREGLVFRWNRWLKVFGGCSLLFFPFLPGDGCFLIHVLCSAGPSIQWTIERGYLLLSCSSLHIWNLVAIKFTYKDYPPASIRVTSSSVNYL